MTGAILRVVQDKLSVASDVRHVFGRVRARVAFFHAQSSGHWPTWVVPLFSGPVIGPRRVLEGWTSTLR